MFNIENWTIFLNSLNSILTENPAAYEILKSIVWLILFAISIPFVKRLITFICNKIRPDKPYKVWKHLNKNKVK